MRSIRCLHQASVHRSTAALRTGRAILPWRFCVLPGNLRSVDVVEVNPILDRENKTAMMAVELVESLFGKTVM